MTTIDDAQQTDAPGRRAIVVDDSRATRSMLRRLLQELDFEVLEAGNGAEALENLRGADRVDLALVDWNMPVMDGLEFVKALRNDRNYADMVVMMVSAESDRTKMARALMVGADEFVIKPVTADVIAGKLEMIESRT